LFFYANYEAFRLPSSLEKPPPSFQRSRSRESCKFATERYDSPSKRLERRQVLLRIQRRLDSLKQLPGGDQINNNSLGEWFEHGGYAFNQRITATVTTSPASLDYNLSPRIPSLALPLQPDLLDRLMSPQPVWRPCRRLLTRTLSPPLRRHGAIAHGDVDQ